MHIFDDTATKGCTIVERLNSVKLIHIRIIFILVTNKKRKNKTVDFTLVIVVVVFTVTLNDSIR